MQDLVGCGEDFGFYTERNRNHEEDVSRRVI